MYFAVMAEEFYNTDVHLRFNVTLDQDYLAIVTESYAGGDTNNIGVWRKTHIKICI